MALILSCLDGWYLALHHNRDVDTLSVLDLWELHGLLHLRIPSACRVSQRECTSAAPVVS